MPRRLTLICHAPTAALRAAAFAADEPIDETGRRDAAALRAVLRPASVAWTSPARRAVETAEVFGLQAVPDAALADADAGRWAGRPFDDVARAEPEAIAAWLGDPDAAPHGGESLRHLLARAAAWLDARDKNTGRAIAVTHAAVIRALVVHAIGAPPASFWRLDVAPLSVTVLQGEGRRWTLARLNHRPGA